MSVTEIVQYRAGVGSGDDFERQLGSGIVAMTRHKACLAVHAYRGIEEPDTFFMVVSWTSIEDHRAWRESPERAEYRSHIIELLAQQPEFAHYRTLGSTG